MLHQPKAVFVDLFDKPFREPAKFGKWFESQQKSVYPHSGAMRLLIPLLMMRHTKDMSVGGERVLTLPPKTQRTVLITLSPTERAAYNAVEMEMRSRWRELCTLGIDYVSKHFLLAMSLLQPMQRMCSGGAISPSRDLARKTFTKCEWEKQMRAPPQLGAAGAARVENDPAGESCAACKLEPEDGVRTRCCGVWACHECLSSAAEEAPSCVSYSLSRRWSAPCRRRPRRRLTPLRRHRLARPVRRPARPLTLSRQRRSRGTTATFGQTQVDGFLTEIATRLDVPPATTAVVGFAPSGTSGVALTVQVSTVQLKVVDISPFLEGFLRSNNTVIDSLNRRGLPSLTAVMLATAASSSSTALPALYSVSTSGDVNVNPSAYYAMIGVGASLGVAFLACAMVVCCTRWRQKLGKRPSGPRAVVGARGGGRWRGSGGTHYTC